jgi:ATP-binding cassette subfamily B protein RaxB
MRSSIAKLIGLLRRTSYQPPFPVILQSDESECGLASLAMLFAAFGRPTRLEDLRRDYGSTRGGETIGDLCNFSERYGFRAIPARTTSIDIKRLPCIIYVRGDHFSVLWKIEKGCYAIADPSDGCLLLDADRFEEYFSGIVIYLRPIPSFKQKQDLLVQPVNNDLDMLPLTSGVAIAVIVLAGVSAILTLATASFQDIFMTYIVEEGDILWTRGLVNLTIGFALVLALATFSLQLVLQRFLQTNIMQWNIRLFTSLFDAPFSFFINKTTGLIVSRFSQVEQALSGFQSAVVSALLGGLNLVIFLVAILWVSLPLTVVSVIGIAGFMYIGIKFFGYNLQTTYLQRQAECQASSAEFKLISGREQIVLEHNQEAIMRELSTGYISQAISQLKINRVENWNEFFLSSVDLLLNTLLLVVSALLIINGSLTTGTYAAVSVIIGTALQPIRSLAQIIEVLQSSRLSFNTANELLQGSPAQITNKVEPRDHEPVLFIENVSFRYCLYSPDIHHRLSLRLSSSNSLPITVRLDGGTGAGKTTLLNLILGILKPSVGRILIKGVDIHSITRVDRNHLVQYIDREPFIIPDTVLNNSLLGTNASPTQLQDCLQALTLDTNPFFCEQSHRLLRDLSSLSSGQAVMVALLRAVLHKPQLLLIDEAMTSLPEETHLPILKGIRQLGINVLLVQHGTSQALDIVPTVQLSKLQGISE